METKRFPNEGDYAMHHMNNGPTGNLVRISSKTASGGFLIEYVSDYGDGTVQSGGSSGTWPAVDFRPITDPKLLAASRIFEANRNVAELKRQVVLAERDVSLWKLAYAAIRETQAVVAKDISE